MSRTGAAKRQAGAPATLPQPGDEALIALARDYWSDADYRRCDEVLSAAHWPSRKLRIEAAFLRARAFIRLRRNVEAREVLSRAESDMAGAEERTTLGMLRGIATSRLDDSAGLRELKEAAAANVADAWIRSEATVFYAEGLWQAGRFDEAEAVIESVDDDAPNVIRARAIQMLGWIETKRARFAIADRHFVEALTWLDRAEERDLFLRALLLQVLSNNALNQLDLPLGRRVRRAAERTTWTSGVAKQRFYVALNLALLSFVEGGLSQAWTEQLNCLAIAHEDAARLGPLCGLASIARFGSEGVVAGWNLDAARELVRGTDWTAAEADARPLLFSYALVLAESDPDAAQAALDAFGKPPRHVDPSLVMNGDVRLDALFRECRGMIALARGDRAVGKKLLSEASAMWGGMGLRLGEARALYALARMTGDGGARAKADRASAPAPTWPMRAAPAARISAMMLPEHVPSEPTGPGRRALSKIEREILAALYAGKTARDYANQSGRSLNTVRNHVKRIHKALGVTNRAELVRRGIELGLIA